MSRDAAAIAANRFGLGARPEELRSIAADPRGWLLEQLVPERAPPPAYTALPATGENLLLFPLYFLQRGVHQALARRARSGTAATSQDATDGALGNGAGGRSRSGGDAGRASPEAAGGASAPAPAPAGQQALRRDVRARVQDAAGARLAAAIATPAPFRERLIWFWCNHFTVSAARPVVAPLAVDFERDVVRPNVVGGRFEDMLSDATRHPAMQLYLDNYRSVGPNSWYARHPRSRPGGPFPDAPGSAPDINENHAREILELHTVGVGGGYSQADVVAFARVLTGWGVRPLFETPSARRRAFATLFTAQDPDAALAEATAALEARFAALPWQDLFRFDERAHEPGSFTVLGKRYPEAGETQGQQVLADLARHPATARFVGEKLCRHFIADTPPPSAVARVARTFRDTEGDLAAVARTLVACPEAWEEDPAKFKRPDEFLVSALRAFGQVPANMRPVLGAQTEMGQRPLAPPGPDGWADDAAHWASPDGIWKRIEWIDALAARRAFAGLDVEALGRQLVGKLSATTAQAVARAATPAQALTLLLVSPEFMRR